MRQFTTLVLALVLALWAVPAAAGDRDERNRDRHIDHERHYDERNRDRHIRHERHYHRGPDVAALSHRLVRATAHVHRRAERTAHHGDRREYRALRALHQLEAEARRFHARVDRGHRHATRNLHRVEHAYRHAARRLPDLHAGKHVRRDFARVGRVLNDLRATHARSHGHRHDRYAHRAPARSPWFHGVFAWH